MGLLYSILFMVFRNRGTRLYFNTRLLDLRLINTYLRATVTSKKFVTEVCVCLEIDHPQVINGGLKLDSEVL